jgi:hypothetical protein
MLDHAQIRYRQFESTRESICLDLVHVPMPND